MTTLNASVRPSRGEYGSHRLRDPFEVTGIDSVEGAGRVRVDVEHGAQRSTAVENRHDDLRSAFGVAGDMPGKRVHVCDNLCLHACRSCTTNTLRELDLEAADRTLIGADSKTFWGDNPIETHPAGGGDAFHQDRGGARHRSYGVGEIFQQRLDLSAGGSVPHLLFLSVHAQRILAPR